MKFVHLSDLHIGKRIKEKSLIADQKYILDEIFEIIDSEKPDGVIIAGDIYDKAVPSAEAVELFDNFLFSLSQLAVQVYAISGNHDSAERIAFGSRLMNLSGVHLSPVYNGDLTKFMLNDEYGTVNIFMLPFVRPADVRRFFPDEEITSYTDAVRTAVEHTEIDESQRNIIITHQFVTGAQRCDSEEKSVGGTDNVDGTVFEKFDYTALGHIHGAQNIGSEKIRYCGTPLKYSFSEVHHKKSVTVIELNQKGNTNIYEIPLTPLRDMRILKGSFAELAVDEKKSEDYLHVILTDEEETINAVGLLRYYYPNILELEYDNSHTRAHAELAPMPEAEKPDPLTIFMEFYEKQTGTEMSDKQAEILCRIIKETEGEE